MVGGFDQVKRGVRALTRRLRGRIWRVIMIFVIFAMWNTTRLLFVLHPPAVHTPRPATGRVRTRTGNRKKHVWNLFCRNGAENTYKYVLRNKEEDIFAF